MFRPELPTLEASSRLATAGREHWLRHSALFMKHLKLILATVGAFAAGVLLAVLWTEFLAQHDPGEDFFGYTGVFIGQYLLAYLAAAAVLAGLYFYVPLARRLFDRLNHSLLWLVPLFFVVYGIYFFVPGFSRTFVHVYWLVLKIAAATTVIANVYGIKLKVEN